VYHWQEGIVLTQNQRGKNRRIRTGYIREPMGKKIEGYEVLIPSEGFKY